MYETERLKLMSVWSEFKDEDSSASEKEFTVHRLRCFVAVAQFGAWHNFPEPVFRLRSVKKKRKISIFATEILNSEAFACRTNRETLAESVAKLLEYLKHFKATSHEAAFGMEQLADAPVVPAGELAQ